MEKKWQRRRPEHGLFFDAALILMTAWVRTHGTGRPAATFGKIAGVDHGSKKDTVPGRRDRL